LYTGLPEGGLKGKRIEVDFNEAFNPPCAFTDFRHLSAAAGAKPAGLEP
jgi:uncharacterized protein (DUF1684 family)